MASLVTGRRVLCRTLLHAGEILSMRLVDLSGEYGEISSFVVETASTVFETSPVVIMPAMAITDFLLDDLDMMSRRDNSIEAINNYLSSSSLYLSSIPFRSDEVAMIRL